MTGSYYKSCNAYKTVAGDTQTRNLHKFSSKFLHIYVLTSNIQAV